VSSLLKSTQFMLADEIVIHANFQPDTVDSAIPFAKLLEESGKSVSVVGLLVFNDVASLSMKLHKTDLTAGEVFYQNLRGKYLQVNELLSRETALLEGVRYLNKQALFCTDTLKECNILNAEDKPFIIDGNHFSESGISMFGRAIAESNWFLPRD